MTIAKAAALIGICPACQQPSDADGLACPACVDAARPYIRHADGTPAADLEVAALLGQGSASEPDGPQVDDLAPLVESPSQPAAPGRKQNQRCWACEKRHMCSPDPDNPGRWICDACLELS